MIKGTFHGHVDRIAPDPRAEDSWLVDLVQDVRDAAQKMSRKNAHRQVLVRCEAALIQLAVRVGELSQKEAHAPTETHPVGHAIIP